MIKIRLIVFNGHTETVGNYEVVLPQITKSYKDKDYNQVVHSVYS